MYYLSNYQEFGEPPEELVDPNIVSSSNPIESIMRLNSNSLYVNVIDSILKNNKEVSRLKYKFDLKSSLTREDIISLLFYFGYLTIEDYYDGDYTFKIPNKVMRDVFVECFMRILNEESMFQDYEVLNEIINPLCEPLLKEVSNNLKNNGKRIYLNLNEKHIQVIIFTLIYFSRKFYAYSEYEVANGYIDIYLKRRGIKSNCDVMIELKYIKKEDFNDKTLNEKIEEGTNQIEKYSQDDRIEKDNLKKYVIIFSDENYTVKNV